MPIYEQKIELPPSGGSLVGVPTSSALKDEAFRL